MGCKRTQPLCDLQQKSLHFRPDATYSKHTYYYSAMSKQSVKVYLQRNYDDFLNSFLFKLRVNFEYLLTSYRFRNSNGGPSLLQAV